MLKTLVTSVLVIVVSASFSYLAFTLGTTYIRNSAIDGCAMASKNVYTEQGQGFTRVIEEPDKNAYQACLSLKNIK